MIFLNIIVRVSHDKSYYNSFIGLNRKDLKKQLFQANFTKEGIQEYKKSHNNMTVCFLTCNLCIKLGYGCRFKTYQSSDRF